MSGFVMNPSKRLTDLLSTYLEFDPQQLQLGIWSGDLSMKDVSLKREAVNPMLCELSAAAPKKVDERPPLVFTLLKSEIGNFRFQIPWKRLVWGGGDVRLTVSDVTLVIGFESQTNSDDVIQQSFDAQALQQDGRRESTFSVAESEEEARESKQEQIREAERRMLQGFPIGPAMVKKQRDASNQAELNEAVSAEEKGAGRLERLLKSVTSSFLWRFFAGLQASIRNVRIVLVQDGVEIGVICHSMDAGAHVEEEISKKNSGIKGESSIGSSLSDIEEDLSKDEVELDAGDRQVDKHIKIRGLGLFVREETTKRPRVPRELSFSTSVTADDYVLRPSEVDAFFSIYYPSKDAKHHKKQHTRTIKDDSSTVDTVETTTSSKARRGKRDRSVATKSSDGDSGTKKDTKKDDENPAAEPDIVVQPKRHRGSKSLRRQTILSATDTSLESKPLLWPDSSTHSDTRTHRSSYTPTIDCSDQAATPHFDINLLFGDIRTLCSKRHHHLVHIFAAAQAKMRNGRPEQTILSQIGPDAAPVTRSVTVETPMKLLAPSPTESDKDISPPAPGSIPRPVPMTALQRFKTETHALDTPGTNNVLRLQLLQPVVHSERSKVVTEWWKYAYSNIIWQFRRRRHLRNVFKPSLHPFDWKKQRYLRKEYVDLYILVRLERRGFHSRLAHLAEMQSGEEELLAIEDELMVEQILLYRSIARALGVRGLNSMPESILELHGETSRVSLIPQSTRKSQGPEVERDNFDRTLYRRRSSISSGGKAVSGRDVDGEEQDDFFLSPIRLEAQNARSRRRRSEPSPKKLTVDTKTETKPETKAETKQGDSPLSKDEAAELTPLHHNRGFSTPSTPTDRAEFFPSGDSNVPSLGSSQVNAAADVPSPDSLVKPELPPKRPPTGVGRSVSFSQHHDEHDTKTIKTFKTTRTANTKRTSTGGAEAGLESRRTIRFSFSLKFQSIELMVCDDDYDLRASLDPSQARQKYDPAKGMGSFDEEEESDEVSELSVVSADFDNQGDVNEVDSEDLTAENNIMSSTDFLLFGTPNSILHVLVSDVAFFLTGNSGGSRSASLTVNQFQITGSESCHLLSSESAKDDDDDQNRSMEAVSEGLGPSIENSAPVVDKALSASLFELDEKDKRMQCDLSKITATVEMRALMKLDAFASTTVLYPRSVIPFSARETVRTYLIERIVAPSLTPVSRANTALRIHGFEVTVPLLREEKKKETDSLRSWNEDSVSKSTVDTAEHDAKVSLSVGLFEFYSGAFVDDLYNGHPHLDDVVTQAYFTAGGAVPATDQMSDVDESVRKLKMLDIEKILARRRPFACQHSVITLSQMDCNVYSNPESAMALSGTTNILEFPLLAEILVSRPYNPELDGDCPSQQVVIHVSPLLALLSEARLEVLSACMLSQSNASRPSLPIKPLTPLPPRVQVLSSHVLQSVEASFGRIRLSVVSDSEDSRYVSLTLPAKEIIMEETISDYLSLFSCFDLEFPMQEPLSLAAQICMDRLSVLGLTTQETRRCVERARLNFLADVEIMKRSHSQALLELSKGAMGSSTQFPQDEGDSYDDFYVNSEAEETSETFDDDSEETMDIIDTTIGNAVEKTVRLFLPVIEERHLDAQQYREILVVDLDLGARVSMVNLFYDFHLSFAASSLSVRNGSGIHVLKVGTKKHLRDGTPSTSNEESDGTSVRTAGDVESGDNNIGMDSDGADRSGVAFSRFELDRGHEFGMGGMPLPALGDDEKADDSERTQERLDDFFIGDTTVFFSQAVFSEMLQALLRLSQISLTHQQDVSGGEVSGDSTSGADDLPATMFCHGTSFSLFLASDELVPFTGFLLQEVSCGTSPDSRSGSKVNISSESFVMLNLTPEGQTYHEVVTPLFAEAVPENMGLSIEMVQSRDPWKESTNLHVNLSSARVLVVRQHINELIQFFLSKKHGLGLLLNKLRNGDPLTDKNGNPPPPLLYMICVENSSLIIPRSSMSSELLAVEVESLTIFNSCQTESWSLPTESTPIVREKQIWPPRKERTAASTDAALTLEKPENATASSGSVTEGASRSDMEFQDCVDRLGDTHAARSTVGQTSSETNTVSSFNRKWISRITVQAKDMRLFTSLASDIAHGDVEYSRFNIFYGIAGRAATEEPVFAPRRRHGFKHRAARLNGKAVSEKRDRKWEEISTNPLSLEVFADYAPHLRLLIADTIGGVSSNSLPFSLDIRMSQFCLLLSLWYTNMQELPVMFPYPDEQVEEGARSHHPPPDFPEFGTDHYVNWLKDLSAVSSEISCVFNELNLCCSFDAPGYFAHNPASYLMMSQLRIDESGNPRRDSLRVVANDYVVHIANDKHGILRLSSGATGFKIQDERKGNMFSEFFSVNNSGAENETKNPLESAGSWADLSWGLDCDGSTFRKGLGQPFQFSVFMTPNWSLMNLGVEDANAIMFDFTPIWIVLDYFTCYFSDAAYGNPAFEAYERKEKLRKSRRKAAGVDVPSDDIEGEPAGLNMDFRLWLVRPHLSVPSNQTDPIAPCLRAESNSGFWFRYKSLGSFSSQEMASTNLSLAVADVFQAPAICRGPLGIATSAPGLKTLVDGLSFALRYDVNGSNNHTSVSIRVPFLATEGPETISSCSITSPEIEVKPIVLPPPTVCSPIVQPTRLFGSTSVCEMMMIMEVFPVASKLILNLATGPSDASETADSPRSAASSGSEKAEREQTFAVSGQIGSLRLFVIDPVLGMHLPVAVASVSSISFTASMLGANGENLSDVRRDAPNEDLQVVIDSHLWADYFKLGVTRSWEPLLEPYQCMVLYEKSRSRGQGMSLNSDSPLHLNVTGALLVTLDETINTLRRSISETFGESSHQEDNLQRSKRRLSFANDSLGIAVEEITLAGGRRGDVVHEIPKPLKSGERVAFSFLNLTGQKIRIHQQAAGDDVLSRTTLTYLEHMESTRLDFKATMSIFKNLDVEEVPFPGLPNSSSDNRTDASMLHTVDVQIPGFAWLQSLSVDTSGRRFDNLVPRSPSVLSKIRQDWRLDNALKLLTEVGLENGGRLITVRSPFEIRNNTSHAISLTCHPDPRHRPVAFTNALFDEASSQSDAEPRKVGSPMEAPHQTESSYERIQPGESYQIPTLLLESALNVPGGGSHLGCLWIRPDGDESLFDTFMEEKAISQKAPAADYCSRPVQLAKVVHESSVIFASGNGEDLPSEKIRSGIQVSCPLSERRESLSFAPFCYVVETRRSPLVSQVRGTVDGNKVRSPRELAQKDSSADRKTRHRDATAHTSFLHGPVAYSLIIHPPLVIENLLPEGGRFELMHASRRSVLWFADLKPGERVPVHSVGLDAPLLLLINLGFCRTPVGEGALVHHGAGKDRGFGIGSQQRVGLKTIGKAVTKGTKQVGKTLTDIIDSPDRRGQGKLFMIQNPQFHRSKNQSQIKKRPGAADSGSLGLDIGIGSSDAARGKVHKVEGQVFSQDDIATETTVVDSIGQRLTLRIENVRGGGGQRRISLFCPFWIVNTTEHSLRYKQEKSSSFTSGTVLSASQDGSKPVDGSNRNYVSQHELSSVFRSMSTHSAMPALASRGTIFAGTPGALATSPGRCTLSPSGLAKLLDKDLPLDRLASMAFMFNFHEDVISIGHQKLCVQLGDAESKYTSSWSAGFSLDSVGVTQVVGMHCKEGRALELSVTISVAPLALSGYTKIIRLSPRYVLMNQLEQPIRIWQDSSLLHTTNGDTVVSNLNARDTRSRKWYISKGSERAEKVNQYESLFGRPAALDDGLKERVSTDLPAGTTAHPSALYLKTAGVSELVPFHLADTRSERQLRIDLGYPWNLTASFSSDITGEYSLKPTKSVDLRLLRHVSTRASPQYRVVLPPPVQNQETEMWDGELGVWFETDWGGDKRIIVKGAKHGRYAFNHTDIHVGDELLLIDSIPVANMPFSDVMKLLKERIAYVGAREISRRESTEVSRRLRRRSTKFLRSSKALADAADADSVERVVLTFRTVEERLRRLRVKASKTNRWSSFDESMASKINEKSLSDSKLSARDLLDQESAIPPHGRDSNLEAGSVPDIHVDMRTLHNSIFVFVRSQDSENPPFRIENRAIKHVVHFRQRGCDWHPWNSLKPGESRSYTWEEPMRQKKLSVRVGRNEVALFGDEHQAKATPTLSDDIENTATRVIRHRQFLSFPYVDSEEFGGFGATKIIKLEEIGFADFLPCPGAKGSPGHLFLSDDVLHCQVDTDGGTRVLVISDRSAFKETGVDEHAVIERHLSTLRKQLCEEEDKLEELKRLKLLLSLRHEETLESTEGMTPTSDDMVDVTGFDTEEKIKYRRTDVSSIEQQAQEMAGLTNDTAATRRHQVVVQVLEATGLNSSDFSGACNPYCEVVFKGRMRKRRAFRKNSVKRRTYYVEKSVAPKWIEQIFVFDVPTEAMNVTRGHSIQIRVKNFRAIGYHPDLGQTSVHLRSLRNQQELVGWYPLVGRSGRSELDDSGNLGRGSIKIRVQWIYTVSGLLDYFVLLSERRLLELEHSRDGMRKQMVTAIEADKRKKSFQDPFSIVRIPNVLGITGTKLRSVVTEEDEDITQRGAWKKLRQSLKITGDGGGFGMDEDTALDVKRIRRDKQLLKVSNAKYLWWLHAQTEESKRIRRFGKETEPGAQQDKHNRARDAIESLDNVVEISNEPHSNVESISESEHSLDIAEIEAPKEAPSPSQLKHQNSSSSLDIEAAVTSIHSLPINRVRAASIWSVNRSDEAAETSRNYHERSRAFSLSDLQFRTENNDFRPFVFGRRPNSKDPKNGELDLPKDILVEVTSKHEGVMEEIEDEAHRLSKVDTLYKEGLLYHLGGSSLHRRHLTYRFRESLLTDVNSSSELRTKSNLRATLWVRDLKSWVTAQAIFNDEELASLLSNGALSEPKRTGAASAFTLNVDVTGGPDHMRGKSVERLLIPNFSPATMTARAFARAENIIDSRNQFEKACRRSLKSVLNPGGWLTIRPITALNLPDTFTGMSVKVRYGTEVLTSQTADAKVTPTWAFDDDVPLTPRPGTGMGKKMRRRLVPKGYEFVSSSPEEFKFDDNDLPIHIEPLQTSGTVRISVIGERLNYKAEIGVLHIPLGAAISCCIESRDDFEEAEKSSSAPLSPFYVRWFPLMSPKDSTPFEGDMGLSSRPVESEKLRDSMFKQYFTPCIKLALIWQPDDGKPEVDGDSAQLQGETIDSEGNGVPNKSAPTLLTHTYFNADVGRVSTALIDSQRAIELLSVSLSDIDVRYSVTKSKTRMTLAVGWVQVDHQDDHAREPVVLAPTPVAHPQPTLQFITVKDNLRSKSNVDSYQYIAVALQEMDLTVEESWMFDLWEFFTSVIRRREVTKKVVRRSQNVARKPFSPSVMTADRFEGHSDTGSLLELLSQDESESTADNQGEKKVYVEQLLLGLVKLNLTYLKGGKKGAWEVTDRGGWVIREDVKDMFSVLPEIPYDVNFSVGGMVFGKSKQGAMDRSEIFVRWCEHTHDEDLWAESEGSGSASHNLPHIIAAVFPSVSDARIRLNGKLIEHVFESPGEILASIRNYYVTETLRQIYKIVGSLDFVGNPTMLFNSFVTGVRDFVVAPSKEFFRNPKRPSRVGIGVAKGTLSLVSHSASGLFGFASKVSATAGQAAAVLSFDEPYKQWHNDMVVSQAKNLSRRWKKKGATNARGILTKPVEDIVLGIISGTSGIFVSPYKGAKQGGGLGFAKGVAVGAVGVVVKPVVGVLDALAHLSGSIHDVAKSVNVLEKRYQPARKLRLPYVFGIKNVLLPFDVVTARSINLLKRYPLRGKKINFAEREVHVASEVLQMEPGVVTYVIATTVRVILLKVKRDSGGTIVPSLCWQVHLNTEAVVSSLVQDEGHNGVALTITRRERKAIETPLKDPKEGLNYVVESPDPTVLGRDHSNFSLGEHSHLGTRSSRVWENLPNAEHEGTGSDELHLHGSAQSQKGDVLEWFRVLGEYHHRKQLTRMHNAICCICGDLDSILREKGLGDEGTKEGYTTFGQMIFESDMSSTDCGSSPDNIELFCALDRVPWLSSAVFQENITMKSTERRASIVAKRKTWLFSDELESASREGGPAWFVHGRARATFIPADPPPLPAHLHPRDEVVVDVFHQLKDGNISYTQACDLIDAHGETVPDESVSGASSTSPMEAQVEEEGSLGDLFQSAAMFASTGSQNTGSGDDTFRSANESLGSFNFVSARSFGPLVSPLAPVTSEEDSAVFKSPQPVEESPTGSSTLEIVSEGEQQDEIEITDESSGKVQSPDSFESAESCSPLQREEGTIDETLEATTAPPEAYKTKKVDEAPKSTDKDDLFFMSTRSPPSEALAARGAVPKNGDRSGKQTDVNSRLDRVESMLEQLLFLNMGNSSVPGTTPASWNQVEDTSTTAELQRELRELKQQVVEQRNFYQEALATAALRQEVADLRREAAGHGGRGLKDADMESLRREVSQVRKQFEPPANDDQEEEAASHASTDEAATDAALRREVTALKLQLARTQRSLLDNIPSDRSLKSSLRQSSRGVSRNDSTPDTPQRKSEKRVMFAAEPTLKSVSKFFSGKR